MDNARKCMSGTCCPHVDDNDSRCGNRFRLGRLEQAFDVCFGTYHVCPMYHQINQEQTGARGTSNAVPLITVTNDGYDVPLRATGT